MITDNLKLRPMHQLKEFQLARRENTLTIEFLAQCLINDNIFPNQEGIRVLFQKAKNHHGNKINLSSSKIHYCFLFHLEDFMPCDKKDKSELDLLLIQDNTAYLVEVKAFTDANATGVKREIVRNYLAFESISKNTEYFNHITDIVPVLIYSQVFHSNLRRAKNGDGFEYEYFNENFLTHYGKNQKFEMNEKDWAKGSYALQTPLTKETENIQEIVGTINEKINFITWDEVRDTISELNENGKFDNVYNSIQNRVDEFNSKFNSINLVKG